VEFDADQRNYPNHLSLRRPSVVKGFVVTALRDYSKQSNAVKNQTANDPYHYQKSEGLEYRFWCDFHRDVYVSVILKTKEPPIVPMKYIDLDYFERMNDMMVNLFIAKFEEFDLKDLMGFKYN
jgi:hypothetical protein